MSILAYLLSAPVARGPQPDLPTFATLVAKCPFPGLVERALWGGFHSDRLGYAFVAGYSAALAGLFEHVARVVGGAAGRALLERPLAPRVCLCATEAGGAHPSTIATRLDEQGGALELNGEKTFATLATISDELLVVASRGLEADGKNRLRLVRVKPGARGVEIVARDPLPFAPEIPHAKVRFTNVVVEHDDVLPGDGYDEWLKPFRTIEDTHVLASTVGYLQGAARAHGFAPEAQAELVSLSLSLIDLGARDAAAPLTHVVLAGLFGSARRLIGALGPEWEKADEAERARWQRDLPLLMVADAVRTKRTETAFKALSA